MNNLSLLFDPTFTNVKDVKQKVLKYNQDGVGFVFDGHIYHKQNGKVNSIQITDAHLKNCFNRNNYDQIGVSIQDMLSNFRSHLQDIINYQFEILSTNQIVTIPLDYSNRNTILMFSVSDRSESSKYFDLCLYDGNNGVLAYNKQKLHNLSHSGDQFGDQKLLHMVNYNTATASIKTPIYLTVVGYSKNPLHTFQEQTPSVCIVNHQTRTVNIVPCPLDIISVGENDVFAILAKCNFKGTRELEISILPRPVTLRDVNTGDSNSATYTAIQTVEKMKVITFPATNGVEEDEFVLDFNEPAKESFGESFSESFGESFSESFGESFSESFGPRKELIVIVQDNHTVPTKFEENNKLYFGKAISFQDEHSDVILPIAGGSIVMGDNSLVHGKKSQVKDYSNLLKSSACVVIVVGEEMQNSLIDKCQSKVNAAFIVVPKCQSGKVADIMENMSIDAVTAMAGPCAIVLAYIRNKFYFYRGVDWPGVIEGASFTDNVTENIENLKKVDTLRFPWSFEANMEDLFFKDSKLHISNLEHFIDTVCEGIQNDQVLPFQDFKNVIFQLQIILTPEAIQKIQHKIITCISNKKKITNGRFVTELISEGRFGEIKKYVKAQTIVYQEILSLLRNAISLQKSSSRKHDINKLLRKITIDNNVKEASEKTMGDLIEEYCEDSGTISCLIDKPKLCSLLEHIKRSGKVSEWLNQQNEKYLTNVTDLCSRMTTLDGVTTNALIANVGSGYSNADRVILFPDISIANTFDTHHPSPSIMFLPLHDKKYEDPFAVSWPDEANNAALIRIKLRSIFANQIGGNILPSDKEVNYLIIYLYFCILEKLTKGRNPSTDADSAIRNISRSVISYILCAASSGQSPLPLYQIVSYNATVNVPDCSVWWMYFKLMSLWKFTGWDNKIITRKFKHFVVKCIRKYVVDPVTSKLRDSNKERKLAKVHERCLKRNAELEWLEKTIPLIQKLSAPETGLKQLPVPYQGEITTRGGVFINKFLKREKGSPNFEYLLKVCNDVTVKRTKNNWKTHITTSTPNPSIDTIDRRLNLKSIPEYDQFKFSNLSVFKNVVRILYDNHMDVENSEKLAVAFISDDHLSLS
jgi:hypothetical protein